MYKNECIMKQDIKRNIILSIQADNVEEQDASEVLLSFEQSDFRMSCLGRIYTRGHAGVHTSREIAGAKQEGN